MFYTLLIYFFLSFPLIIRNHPTFTLDYTLLLTQYGNDWQVMKFEDLKELGSESAVKVPISSLLLVYSLFLSLFFLQIYKTNVLTFMCQNLNKLNNISK